MLTAAHWLVEAACIYGLTRLAAFTIATLRYEARLRRDRRRVARIWGAL